MTVIPSAQAAVLIIDVQVGLFCTAPPPFDAVGVIARMNYVAAKARTAHVPVIFIQHDGPPQGNWLVPNTDRWLLHPELKRLESDPIIRKTTGDAFYGSDLERTLRVSGIQQLVLMGYATDFCIDSTLRNAASKEFELFVISDAHTTNDAPMLKAYLIRDYFNWVWSDSLSRCGIRVSTAAEIQFRDSSVVR
jgi:nicotinamidase-related amidase